MHFNYEAWKKMPLWKKMIGVLGLFAGAASILNSKSQTQEVVVRMPDFSRENLELFATIHGLHHYDFECMNTLHIKKAMDEKFGCEGGSRSYECLSHDIKFFMFCDDGKKGNVDDFCWKCPVSANSTK